MALSTTSASGILTPEQVDELFIKPVIRDSIAAAVARTVMVEGSSLRVPILETDPSAGWTLENAPIAVTDPTVSDLDIPFYGLKALVTVSSELLADTNGLAISMVGEGLARDTANKIDQAFFGSTVTNGPSGLGSVSGVQAVDAGSAFDSLDPFLEAISKLETVGTYAAAFVTTPAVALLLSQLKITSGSNQHLLQPDATSPTARSISGVPLFVTSAVAANTVWVIPFQRTILAIRKQVEVATDASVAFGSDAVAVRPVARIGTGFPAGSSIAKVTLT